MSRPARVRRSPALGLCSHVSAQRGDPIAAASAPEPRIQQPGCGSRGRREGT
jgi:hypothetical protein